MPDWKAEIQRRLGTTAALGAGEDRMLGELADHLDDLYREALRTGATPDDAFAGALEALGDVQAAAHARSRANPAHVPRQVDQWMEQREEKVRGLGGLARLLADALRDLRLGVRSLARRPLFSVIVVAVLAIGIGGTTSIFTLVDAILLSPLPFEAEDRLVSVHHVAPALGFSDAGQCAAWHATYESQSETLAEIGMFLSGTVAARGSGTPEALQALTATSGLVRALGLRPLVGRTLRSGDEAPGAEPIVLLAHHYWESRFGAAASAVGQTLHIDGTTHEIVGVLPRELQSLGVASDVVLPMEIDPARLYVGNIGYGGVARLSADASLEEARAELQQILPSAWVHYPGGPFTAAEDIAAFSVRLLPLRQRLVGETANVLWVLLGSVGLVLLVACANVANLLLVRAHEQSGEMAVRAAVGASAARIRWEAFKEILLLSLAGGAAGLTLAALGLKALLAAAPADVPRLSSVTLSPRVLAVTLLLSLLAAAIAGLAPLLGLTRTAAAQMGQGPRGLARSNGSRFQTTVATLQIALVLVLLVASGLLLRSFRELRGVDPGFGSPETVHTVRLHIPETEEPDVEAAARQFEEIAHRLEEVPGVVAVGMATAIPMDGSNNVNTFFPESTRDDGTEGGQIERHKWVGGGFFEALEIPILVGRGLTWSDTAQRRRVAVVSESLARKYWGSLDQALGQRIAARPDPTSWTEVVGVAADVHDDGVAQSGPSMVYWPQVTTGFWRGTDDDAVLAWRENGYAIRTQRMHDGRLLEDIQTAVWSVNPGLPLLQSAPLKQLVSQDPEVAGTLFVARLLTLASALALLLGVTGVYGLISGGVAQQAHELGIRMAFGASGGTVKAMVLRRGLRICAVGTLLGLGVSLGLGRFLGNLLFGVEAFDPATFAASTAALVLVVLGASYLPARRAAQVDPIRVIRAE